MDSSNSDEKAERSPPFSSSTVRERTLSYYFHLQAEDCSSPRAPNSQPRLKSTSRNLKAARQYDHSKHTTPSHEKPLLAMDDHEAPLSWLAALFSGRKRKQRVTSLRHGGEDAAEHPSAAMTISTWEAPRASTWEQLSSWEKPSWDHPVVEQYRIPDTEKEIQPAIASEAAASHHPPLKKQESSTKAKLPWMKNLLALRWAIKLKRRLTKKRVAEQERGDGEDDEEASTMSAVSSARPSDYTEVGVEGRLISAGQDRVFHSQRELGETWSSHYSPLLHSNSSLKHVKLKLPSSHLMRDEAGLLRFYLTPTRGIKFGTKRPKNYHPLVPRVLEV